MCLWLLLFRHHPMIHQQHLQTVSENLAASRGRIQDADFAAETAALTKAQILQQAGVSVLSQANAQPQLALSLLQ